MRNLAKITALVIVLTIMFTSLMSIFMPNRTYAANISSDINSINTSKYPGIKEKIDQLQAKYPNWKFKLLYTGLNWSDVIANEYTGHGTSPKNLIYKNSTYQGEWICSICGDRPYDNGSWRCASEQAIKYIMDPRNWMDESNIFQFEELTNCESNLETIKTMTKGTFLENHEQGIIDAATNNNVNAYYIVARLIQEQGKSGTVLTAGNGYNDQYKGLYNAFNIAASGNSTAEIITNGLAYAQKKEWTTLEKSIDGGISFLAKQYIQKGQNTLYLQKFDVEETNGLYSHQYMQNITAAQSEGITLKNTYNNINSISSSHTFIIPVYENMPSQVSPRPNSNISNTVIPDTMSGDLVKVNVDGSLRIRDAANGTNTLGYLYLNEIVTRLEKATTKVAGTYWDKIKKSDGTIGYAARETYESESKYKLYLVPVNNTSNNNTTSVSTIKNTSKVKLDTGSKIITVTPDAIANDILDACGGSIKIVRADGNYLDGKQEKLGTGYVVDDKYTVIKKGDVNGDGKVSPSDYVLIKNYILENNKLNENQKNAADANKDGKISPSDYVLVKNCILYGTQL